ncbi:hypothetical protein KDW_58900 [Dictyobacter vulcani]|uniref:Uncharacterized protein n=1 Tax=Dictyobacter vulcani TaxID=2607529 RepID=A0A5J4KPV1_9CHLR|nr:hypothetical protein [Dictyobacter vulcani]GER91728.1 hypothetical protein KDW_58900 [Dictyobacter vulcani]
MQEIAPEHLQNSPLALDNPCWYHAMTLMERLASLQAQCSVTRIAEPCDRERAARTLQAWKEQDAFSKGVNFAQRLAAEQLTEEEFLVLLGEPIEAVQQRTPPPDWLLQLAEVFASVDPVSRMEDESQLATQHSFIPIFNIFCIYAHDRFMSRVATLDAEYTYLPFDPQTIASLFLPDLTMMLSQAINHTLVLELNVAHLHGRLSGQTPEDRLQEFSQQMRQKQSLQVLMAEYPCWLARS